MQVLSATPPQTIVRDAATRRTWLTATARLVAAAPLRASLPALLARLPARPLGHHVSTLTRWFRRAALQARWAAAVSRLVPATRPSRRPRRAPAVAGRMSDARPRATPPTAAAWDHLVPPGGYAALALPPPDALPPMSLLGPGGIGPLYALSGLPPRATRNVARLVIGRRALFFASSAARHLRPVRLEAGGGAAGVADDPLPSRPPSGDNSTPAAPPAPAAPPPAIDPQPHAVGAARVRGARAGEDRTLSVL